MGFQNAGAKAGAPCSLEMLQGFLDLQIISFAASAECGRSGRPWVRWTSCTNLANAFLDLLFERRRGI